MIVKYGINISLYNMYTPICIDVYDHFIFGTEILPIDIFIIYVLFYSVPILRISTKNIIGSNIK